jgi:hypothetical protein
MKRTNPKCMKCKRDCKQMYGVIILKCKFARNKG